MGAGLQQWWLSGRYESECAAFDRRQRLANFERGMFSWTWEQMSAGMSREEVERMFPHPRASEGFRLLCAEHGIYGLAERGDNCGPCAARARAWGCQVCGAPAGEPCTKSCDDDSVPDAGVLQFSKVSNPDEISEPASIDCGDRETAESIIRFLNEPPDPARVESFRASMKGKILLTSTPAGPSTIFDGIEFVVDERLGPGEHYLLPKKAWRDVVNPNKESTVEKRRGIQLPQTHTLRPCDRCKETMECEPMLLADGRMMHPGCWAKIDPTQPLTLPPLQSVGARDAKPTIAGKVENVQRAIDAGMLPTGSAAKRVFESLFIERANVGVSLPQPIVLEPPAQLEFSDDFDVAVNSADLWSIYRHPKCDGFVFDSEATGQTVFIGYDRLREMAKLFLLPCEKTERGERLRRRIQEAVGEASTLFQGKGGVFDSERALKIAENLARDIELGPGLDSLPGIGRALALERNPEPEPLDHLDVDLLAGDAKPGEG